MAGDWIKVERAALAKPEILEMAEVLGIDRHAVLGKLLEVWFWFDEQTKNGNASGVSSVTLMRFIDERTGVTGFGEGMQKAGWLEGCSIPNFDRHNGETAKNRALTNKRVKRFRNESNVTHALPEKRREEKKVTTTPALSEGTSTPTTPTPPKRARRGVAVPFPADFVVDDALREWAKGKGYGRLDEHLEAFRAKCAKAGREYVDWRAAFQEAIREDWAGLRGKNGNHAAGAPASGWKAGAEPNEVLAAAAELVEIEAWKQSEGETHGQFRRRIVDAGGEHLLRGRG